MKYELNALNIDAVSNEVDAYLARRKTENKDRVKTKLAVEETLLNYMSAFGSEAEFTVDFGGGSQSHRGALKEQNRGQTHERLLLILMAYETPSQDVVNRYRERRKKYHEDHIL